MPGTDHDGHYDVYWPRATPRGGLKPLAPRFESLDGRIVLQLWDYIFHGDRIFALLEEGLKARFPDVRFVSWREIGNILGRDEREVLAALPARLRELGVDAAITGMAC